MKAKYGWSIVRRGGWEPYHAYKRDTPDLGLIPTFPTRAEAERECKRRNMELGFGPGVLGEATQT